MNLGFGEKAIMQTGRTAFIPTPSDPVVQLIVKKQETELILTEGGSYGQIPDS